MQASIPSYSCLALFPIDRKSGLHLFIQQLELQSISLHTPSLLLIDFTQDNVNVLSNSYQAVLNSLLLGYKSFHGKPRLPCERAYKTVSEAGVKSDPASCFGSPIEKTNSVRFFLHIRIEWGMACNVGQIMFSLNLKSECNYVISVWGHLPLIVRGRSFKWVKISVSCSTLLWNIFS